MARRIISDLCHLKTIKSMYGKTGQYEQLRPGAWSRAFSYHVASKQ